MLTSSVACDVSSLFATKKCEKIQKIDKIVITCKENLHVFRRICGISMEFSGKVYDNIKSYKEAGPDLLSRKCSFGKNYRSSNWPLVILGLKEKKIIESVVIVCDNSLWYNSL